MSSKQDVYATNRVLYDKYAIAADTLARSDGHNVHTADIASCIDSGNTTQGINGLDFLASGSTVYPGWRALVPVVGAALVIGGGLASPRWGARLLLGTTVGLLGGDHSRRSAADDDDI